MAFEASQGITFSFDGQVFTANSIQASKKTPEIDVTSLASPNGSYRSYRLAPIREGDEFTVDFVGLSMPMMTATGLIVLGFDGSGSNAGFSAGYTTVTVGGKTGFAALCTGAQVTAKVGELIQGNMSLRLTYN
jgi:hypothetical protein